MIPKIVDVTAITGQRVVGPVTSWQTPDGPYLVEHLAGRNPSGELIAFFWSPRHDWQAVNVSQKTGQKIAGQVTSWITSDGPYLVEHLAGRSPNGDLLVFYWSPRQDWQVVNVSQKTGQKIAESVTSWITSDGTYKVEHLAGRNPSGDLLVFYWSPRQDWQVVNVSQKTGQKISSRVSNWLSSDGPTVVEHLAGSGADGSLYVFWWTLARDWQVVNVSQITLQKVSGPVTSWLAGNVEHLAGPGPDNSLQVFWWTPATNWRAVNVSAIAGEKVVEAPTIYQLSEGGENVELLGAKSLDGSLLLYWWKPTLDWQAMNLSEITGRKIVSAPRAWLTGSGAQTVEHLAAEGENQSLLVFWGDAEPRRLTDALSQPFQSLKRMRNLRHKVLAILWDPHRTTDPAPAKAAIESIIFGATNSVRHYYLENSNGQYTIESAGVLGWYPAIKPAAYYWGPADTGDTDGDGWVNPHTEKWAEAIRKANADFDFKAYDINLVDGELRPNELGILIVIPQNSPYGTNRDVVGREYPISMPLVVDGVTIKVMAEVYIGNPPNLGVVAHELGHLLLGLADMYFNLPNEEPWRGVPFDNPFAAGDYSIMDRTYKTTHLDPFAKLKFGWVRPRLILRSGRYTLPDVETRYIVWVLMDPRRGAQEYFIIENRWPGASYDKPMADKGGLAVWHIIENPEVYGSRIPPKPPNAPPSSRQDLWEEKWKTVGRGEWGRRAIRMIRPVWNTADDSKALWDGSDPATGSDLLSVASDPKKATLRWADGTPSGFALRALPAAGPAMTITVEVPF